MAATRPLKLSRWQLDLFVSCPRCFWTLKRHNISQPKGFPLALNTAMDLLLKAEFDEFRRQGLPHPLLTAFKLDAKLFGDAAKLQEWRNPYQGLRWTDPATGHTLFGAVDDILELPDGSLAVLDYKSSGARAITIYPSYQLQMDVYTYLLQQLGYRTAPRAFFAFFVAVKDDGFNGRLPFRGTLVEVAANPGRVPALFEQAIALAQSDRMPACGAECDVCRWTEQVVPIVTRAVPPPATPPPAAPTSIAEPAPLDASAIERMLTGADAAAKRAASGIRPVPGAS